MTPQESQIAERAGESVLRYMLENMTLRRKLRFAYGEFHRLPLVEIEKLENNPGFVSWVVELGKVEGPPVELPPVTCNVCEVTITTPEQLRQECPGSPGNVHAVERHDYFRLYAAKP